MGRITSYDQNGRTVADFDKSEYDLMHGWVGTEMERLRIENGKLRELARDLYDAIDSVFWDGEVSTRERLEPRMRELGIEVEK